MTEDSIGGGTYLINCLTGSIYDYWFTMSGCKTASAQTVFNAYTVSRPLLVQLSNGTWAAPLAADSAALTGGCATYFSAENDSAAYGDTPTYIAGETGAAAVTAYQGGGTRASGVIGAYGTAD